MVPILRAVVIGISIIAAGCSALVYKLKHKKPIIEQPIVEKDLSDLIITDTENKTPSDQPK